LRIAVEGEALEAFCHVVMSELLESIKRGLEEAIAFAEGETTSARVHQPTVTVEKHAPGRHEEHKESLAAPSSFSCLLDA